MVRREKLTIVSVKLKKHFLVARSIYAKTARLVEVVSPNVLRIENSGRQEEVQLIGLMDMSPKAHGKMRAEIQKNK